MKKFTLKFSRQHRDGGGLSTYMPIKIIEELREQGLKIPHDMSDIEIIGEVTISDGIMTIVPSVKKKGVES